MALELHLKPGVESRHFLSFCFPCNAQLEDKGELNEWIERMIFLYEDLKWLLSQPVNVFWNQVIYDSSWNLFSDSFLQHAPRIFDLKNIPENCKPALSRVSRLFLLAIKRMSVHDEDKKLSFTPEVFGDIIYENYLFDAAKLFDICSVFYRPDEYICTTLKEIFENIFKSQPKYYNDLSDTIDSMVSTLINIEEKVSHSNKQLKPVNGREAQDMMSFLYDMANTLKLFVQISPNSSHIFFKSTVMGKLASVCESVLPVLLQLIEINRKRFKYMCREIEKCFTQITHTTIQHAFIQKIKNESDHTVIQDLTAEYVALMDSIAQQPRFLASYCELGTINSDFETVAALDCVDISSLEYIKNIITSVVHENGYEKITQQLRELLPTKSEAYINTCIEKYGPNVDVIINNVIEGNIPDQSEDTKVKSKPIVVPNKNVLEDNKEHVALLKASLLSVEDDGDDEFFSNLYDDEYDDTYDSQNVAAADADSADELKDITSRRKFTIPAILRQAGDVSSESDSEGEGKDENDSSANNNVPATDTLGDYNRGGRGSRRGRGVGNQRGRGGGANSRGRSGGPGEGGRGGRGGRGRGGKKNHNRRVLADKKRSKGMMPF